MLRNLGNLVAIRFKEFFREPEIIFWSIVFPILLSWLLGAAIGSGGPRRGSAAVVGSKGFSADSTAAWIEKVTAGAARAARPEGQAPGVAIRLFPMGSEEAVAALKKGRVSLVVERGPDGALRYRFDPRNSDAERTWLVLEREVAGRGHDPSDPGLDPSVSALEVPGTRYIDFLLPGLLAMNVMNSAMWGVAWSLIETRMKKFLRRMAATPMSRQLFLGSHFITRLIITLIQSAALYVFVYFYFGVVIQGSVWALLAVFATGSLAFTGIAVLISSRTGNSRVGNGLINAITLPMMLLSGIFFSYQNFPAWSVPLVRALPLTMVADSLRAIFNEGAGIVEVGGQCVVLAVTGAALFYAGSKLFRWY